MSEAIDAKTAAPAGAQTTAPVHVKIDLTVGALAKQAMCKIAHTVTHGAGESASCNHITSITRDTGAQR